MLLEWYTNSFSPKSCILTNRINNNNDNNVNSKNSNNSKTDIIINSYHIYTDICIYIHIISSYEQLIYNHWYMIIHNHSYMIILKNENYNNNK